MNNNQVAKALERAGSSYKNTQKYGELLRSARRVKISFKGLTNTAAIAADYIKFIKTAPVRLPFDNLLFDITDYPMTSMEDGNVKTENFAIHLQPYMVEMGEHKLVTMVVTDIRISSKLMMSRSYVIYADQAGLHVMTAVDQASNSMGCNCHRTNVFSANPEYANAFSDILPCFSMDVGLALPDCMATKSGCAPIVACRQEIAGLIKVLLAYANLPSNFFVRVVVNEKKRQDRYHIICDMNQWEALKAGNESAEYSGNSFVDGSNLLVAMGQAPVVPPTEVLAIGNKTYTPLAREDDETRTSRQDSQEGHDGHGSSMDSNITENAS